jgi:hypothetical protein
MCNFKISDFFGNMQHFDSVRKNEYLQKQEYPKSNRV